jgi:hypothetical protein
MSEDGSGVGAFAFLLFIVGLFGTIIIWTGDNRDNDNE